jgi:hypothetical protein
VFLRVQGHVSSRACFFDRRKTSVWRAHSQNPGNRIIIVWPKVAAVTGTLGYSGPPGAYGRVTIRSAGVRSVPTGWDQEQVSRDQEELSWDQE